MAWRVGACRHVHRTPAVTASLLVAEHPRGVVAMVEICNATSAAIHVSPRSLPGAPFLLWDGEAVPAYLGPSPGGGGPWLAPGETLAFDVELGELYASAERNGGRPHPQEIAFLFRRYCSEFTMNAIPPLVQRIVFPLLILAGRLSGRLGRYAQAPAPAQR